MPRVRSPNYPAISLPDAIKRVAQVFAKEHRHPTPKDVVAKDMGYSGLNGASLGAISAASKYGLLEREGEDYRVSEKALAILHPKSPLEKADLIREASVAPNLFGEMIENFKGELPSDDNLRTYLVRRGFASGALTGVIQAFRETMELVKQEAGGYTPSIPALARPETEKLEPTPRPRDTKTPYETVFRRASGEEPFRVTFLGQGNGIEIVGRIADAESADDLIRAVSALKLLLKKIPDQTKVPEHPDPEPSQPDPSGGVSFMITQEQRAKLQQMGYDEAAIKVLTPAMAHSILGQLK